MQVYVAILNKICTCKIFKLFPLINLNDKNEKNKEVNKLFR